MKRIYCTKDDSGHWYVIPFELKEKFNELLSIGSAEYSEDEEANRLITDANIEFDELFGSCATGGNLNNVELYAKN